MSGRNQFICAETQLRRYDQLFSPSAAVSSRILYVMTRSREASPVATLGVKRFATAGALAIKLALTA